MNAYEVENLPIVLNDKFKIPIINIVKYILHKKRENIDLLVFESLIDSIIYELYFPEEIRAKGCGIWQYSTNIPELHDDWNAEQKIKTIEKVYTELSRPSHPISIAMARQKTVPEVRVIEGLDK